MQSPTHFDADALEKRVVLKGRPTAQDFVRFVKKAAVDGYKEDEVQLACEWQEAKNRLRQMEAAEAGLADLEEICALPRALEATIDRAIEKAPRRDASLLPSRWAWVELDRLVIWQKSINLSFVEQLKSTIRGTPTDEELAQLAVCGFDTHQPPVKIVPHDANTFSFSSPSNDLRALSIVPLDPSIVGGEKPEGSTAGVLGVFVGYGSNLMRGIRVRNRIVLLNGSHRACALRSLGATHAPLLVQMASDADDLELIGAVEVKQQADLLFRSPRPPLFKDYFDERVSKTVLAPRRSVMLKVEVKIQQLKIPSF
jgi:hypothetical protein